MSDNKPQGGAGTSLGAHSKDGAPGSTGTSLGASAGSTAGSQSGSGSSSGGSHGAGQHGAGADQRSGNGSPGMSGGQHRGGTQEREHGDSAAATWQQTGAELAGQAREGMERVASGVRDAAATARDTIATRGSQAMESTGQMVRDQPLMALAVTGIACFAIGMMIGRGRY